ncbi:MAG: translation elongation factor Ts [Anaerolineales bacterium]|nr:MAG: translation elongation factor Ts [Anaerolineales bacterium]
MSIPAADIKRLREQTGAGILDCRKALEANAGDMEKAVVFLREKGLADAEKRSGRDMGNGRLELYDHGDGRVGVMVEVNCETDFVARTEEFRKFTHEIALQVAAASPRWVTEAEVPDEILQMEKDIAHKRAVEEGKPENVIDRIVEGRLQKFLDERCLMRQAYIRDEERSVEELVKEMIANTGENISVRRFRRWEVGEDTE